MDTGTLFFELALTFYLIAAVMGIIEILKSAKALSRTMLFLSGLGFFAHTLSIIYRYVYAGHIPISNPHEATSFFSWCIVLMFFIIEYRYRVGLLGSFIMPLVFLFMNTYSR